MKRLKFIALVLILFFPINELGGDEIRNASNNNAVALEVFEGVKSILLIWSLPADIVPESVIIYRTNDLRTPFREIAELDPEITRYNDLLVEQEERYFYRVEAITKKGLAYTSSVDTPPFCRPLKMNDSLQLMKTVEEIEEFRKFEDLVITILNDRISALEMDVNQTTIEALSNLIMKDEMGVHPLVEKIPLVFLSRLGLSKNQSSWVSVWSDISQELDAYAPIIRNRLLLSPDEWISKEKVLLNHIQNRLEELSEIYIRDLDYLDQLPPLTVIGQTINSDQSVNTHLLIVNPNQLDTENLYLISGDEFINLDIPENTEAGNQLTVSIPKKWLEFDLVNGENRLQSIPVIPLQSGGFIITLDNEYYLPDSLTTITSFQTALEKPNLWLNEMVVDAESQTLSLEVAGKPEEMGEFGFFLNDSLIWDLYSIPSYEVVYFDSTFSIAAYPEDILWVHFKQRNPEQEWSLLESRPVLRNRTFLESRIPDKGSWQRVDFPTLGKANTIEKISSEQLNIPEIFALYQNYPNPFNITTTITFDLLQPSVISLYVTDATGRIVDILLEDENMIEGTYHFVWSGEHRSSGVYFMTIQAQITDYMPVVFSRKMIYLK